MSMNDIAVFDRPLLQMRRRRAAARMHEADFLLAHVADELVERISIIKRDFPIALDLGSHTGLLARRMDTLASIGLVVRADPVAALLGGHALPAVVCEEEALPFAAESLDLVASPFALHLVNDLPGALVQIARALKGDGLFLAAVLGGASLRELRQSFIQAESELSAGAGARVAPFIDVRDMGALLQRAGFALPVTDADPVRVTYRDMFALIRDLRQMGMTNMLCARSRKPLSRTVIARAAQIYGERFAEPSGRIRATFEIIYAAGWKPHHSQQKPLRPGTATHRLADILGTSETKLTD